MDDILSKLVAENKAYCIAPAGAGKTEIIIQLCARQAETYEKQLILTHTHAGVHSIKKRLYSKGYTLGIVDINTIDSFCIDWVHAYPQLSGMDLRKTAIINWPDVRLAFLRLIKNSHIKKAIQHKWKCLIVDEYQDCGKDQHKVIVELAQLMKTHIFGDPLQGIFDFDGSILNWDQDVAGHFVPITFDPIPARWMKTAPELGRWLMEKRKEMIEKGEISLEGDLPKEITVHLYTDYRKTLSHCSSNRSKNIEDSHLIIHHQAGQCHNTARSLGAIFRSIEELEFEDLHDFAKKFDNATNGQEVDHLIEFAESVATGITQAVKDTIKNLRSGKQLNHKLYRENKDVFDKIVAVSQELNHKNSAQILSLFKNLPGVKIFRRENWYLGIDAFQKYSTGAHESLTATVSARVNQYRHGGRMEDKSIIGRIRLVKGLEYDHVYIFNFQQFSDIREAYVALTRAKKSLTIFTDRKVFSYSTDNIPQLMKNI